MDGSQHPERADASVVARDVPDPFSHHHTTDVTSRNLEEDNTSVKRQNDNAIEDPEAKRQHLDMNEPEDLDLDALMVQLQHHTERASGDDDKATTDSKNQPQDNELSIEQQLKGALSSLQGLEGYDDEDDEDDEDEENRGAEGEEGEDDDDDDDDDEAALALDQLSKILDQSEASISASGNQESSTPSDTRHQEGDAEQTDNPSADNNERRTSFPAEYSKGTGVIEVGFDQKSSDDNTRRNETGLSTTNENGAKETNSADLKSKDSLFAKMPPPPSHSGSLPPMPPPPAALTSPTAPLTAMELSRNSHTSRSSSSGSVGMQDRALNSRLNRIFSPTFSEAPTLSNSYEMNLADQVDKVSEGLDTEKKEDSHLSLLLNDNQAILSARQRSIPLLDLLATQVLDILSSSHYQETLATVMQPDSERGMAYRIILDAFEDVKRLYSKWKTQSSRMKPQPKPDEVRPFIPANIPGVEPTRENLITLQRANLATFVAAIFGTIEIGFWELDKWFIKVFVPENGRLLKQQANIYLDLKTQAYISAVESSDDKKDHAAALRHLFPLDLETQIQDLLGDRMSLAPSEQDFVEKCHRRRENIKAEDEKDLSTKYHWVPFLREVSDYISRNHSSLLPQRKTVGVPESSASPSPVIRSYVPHRKHGMGTSSRSPSITVSNDSGIPNVPRRTETPDVAVTSQKTTQKDDSDIQISSVQPQNAPTNPKIKLEDSAHHSRHEDGKEAPKGDSAKPNDGESGSSSDKRRHPEIPAEGHPLFPPLPKQVILPPSLSASETNENSNHRLQSIERKPNNKPGPRSTSQIAIAANNPADTLSVYEAAKASAEGTDAVRPKTSLFTTRRTWTKEEEEALLKGMDRVQGPYWAQILELYGPGGKISEVLKDRSQVQLKDKARNLKMFFLRLGLPIPAVFQYVTGDYETRRISGKKIRERRQQRPTTSSEPSQQINPPVTQHQEAPKPSSSVPSQAKQPLLYDPSYSTQNATNTPQTAANAENSTSVSTSQNVEVSNPGKTPESNNEPNTNSNSQKVEATTRQEKPAHLPSKEFVKETFVDPIPHEAEESRNQNENSGGKVAQEIPAESEGNIVRLHQSKSVHTTSDDNKNDSAQPMQHDVGDDQSHPTNDATEPADKEDDISTILNRVGKYVENH